MTEEHLKPTKELLKTEAGRMKFRQSLTEILQRKVIFGKKCIDIEAEISKTGLDPEEQMLMSEIYWQAAKFAGVCIHKTRVN